MGARYPVITGLGIVAAPGCGVEANWRAIASGTTGLKPLTVFPSPRFGHVLAGEVSADLTALGAPLRGSRSDRLAWLAAREAILSSGIDPKTCGEQTGVLLGSSVGGSFDSEHFLTELIKRGKMRPRATRFHECASAVDLIAEEFGFFGPSMAVATACSSGALAIATAAEMIQSGEADVMIAGGADSLSRMTWGGFQSLLLVDEAGCRPFDVTRAGTTMGEGAGILVLESEESARKRGATILARLSGWGASCDAHHSTAPHPEGAGAIAAMQSALRRADLKPAEINYVNAHGTGTRDNDLAESKALKTVFGNHVPPISSTKRFFGHALAASGAIEAVVCIEALRRQQIPPNPGFTTGDPAIGLEPVTELRNASLTHVMSNSFGFGGNNAVLIFSEAATVPRTRFPENKPIAVVGLGLVGPGVVTDFPTAAPLPVSKIAAHSCGTLDNSPLSTNQRRRLCRMVQMAILAARRSHTPNPAERLSVAMATGYGCLEEGAVFIENFISTDERERMPSRFSGSVHNAPAAQIAIDLSARAMNSAPTSSEISFESALWQGMNQLATHEADAALVGAVDELNKYPLSIGQRWNLWNAQTRPGEGAVVASLARLDKTKSPIAHVTAMRLGRYRKPFDAQREADWIASAINLEKVEIILSGAKGWPILDGYYEAVLEALSIRAKRALEHRTYKQDCGEFHSASAFGFAAAVDLVRNGSRGVLLYTLSPRGAKALTFIEP